MKLYTEEQVLKFINDNFDEGCSQLIGLTPIELPSDEEIFIASLEKDFVDGLTYFRNKIQEGNK